MIPLVRTLIGLLLGGLGARVLAMLARFHTGASTVRKRASRRTFVRNATLGAVGVALAEVAGGFVYFFWPNKTGAFGSKISVPAASIPPVKGVPFRSVPGKFFLVHNDDGLLALYTKCPHLGCTVPWKGPADAPNAFQCPCHGSRYDYNGVRTGGPAPRPMDTMPVTVGDDGTVTVDTNPKVITARSAYTKDQAVAFTS